MEDDDQGAPEVRKGEEKDQEVETILIGDDQDSLPTSPPDLCRPGARVSQEMVEIMESPHPDHHEDQLDEFTSPVDLLSQTSC